jgi:hypothetical protein
MIRKAAELVKPRENAIAIFTRGDLLIYDPNGDGKTGNWKVNENKLSKLDKVIIYLRDDPAGINRVYMGDYEGWKQSPEPQRKIIQFSKLKEMGKSTSNWVQFGGSKSGWPFFYIRI